MQLLQLMKRGFKTRTMIINATGDFMSFSDKLASLGSGKVETMARDMVEKAHESGEISDERYEEVCDLMDEGKAGEAVQKLQEAK